MVEGGPIDVLTGDWLAELTMLILARTRVKRSGWRLRAHVRDQMEQVMGTCLDKGIKVVSNAGGLDPDGCADAVPRSRSELGLHPKIAYVRGDDLMPRMDRAVGNSDQLVTSKPASPSRNASRVLTANAYLGCWGIVDALEQGADIVITGRTTDAAVVCGPAAWHHGWSRNDWDAPGGRGRGGPRDRVRHPGHRRQLLLLHGSAGNERAGLPLGRGRRGRLVGDRQSTTGTGGEVSIGTVTSQLLYEIGGPEYFGPDVTTRFDTIQLEQRRAGSRTHARHPGRAAAPRRSRSASTAPVVSGNDMNVCLVTGLDIEEKAKLDREERSGRPCPYDREDFASGDRRGSCAPTRPDPETNEEAEWR